MMGVFGDYIWAPSGTLGTATPVRSLEIISLQDSFVPDGEDGGCSEKDSYVTIQLATGHREDIY